jgi:hypothetical protein
MQIVLARRPRHTSSRVSTNHTKPEDRHGKIHDREEGLLRSEKTSPCSASFLSSTPRRSSTLCLPHLALPFLLPLFLHARKKTKSPAPIRRFLHRRSFWVLLASSPLKISPPASVSNRKSPVFPGLFASFAADASHVFSSVSCGAKW